MIESLLKWLRIDPYEPVFEPEPSEPLEPDDLKEVIRHGRVIKDRADRHSERVERIARSWEDLLIGGKS